ncbi:hypothetical protein KZ829_00380 [Actinoplanes hulinensis]|uniref:DeoxyPurine in DNA protein A domain-containing protein n=1 Tax=Actinoplanes hulinensis TaxID=1144547 RepID=A0ABS7ATU1_9ACTN|nr:hypothetical protein [Actinoplanes hulinensis]MBW6432202.1 hypothetical protein [Actinoplanes hulinensis]
MKFLLGSHHPAWLGSAQVPLFISDRRLRGYRRMPRAAMPWALDSGGFTELSTYGSWEQGPTPQQYIARVRRYYDEIGRLEWVAPQDWMCEPWILAKTGLTVRQHQRLTVDNYCRLRDLAVAADLPADLIKRVVQGWTPDEYLWCADAYDRAGVNLADGSLVGVGTVCRRQATDDAGRILANLHSIGVTRLHGFGFKVKGLQRFGALLASADSLAWSFTARRRPALADCTGHKNCANCPRYAYQWHEQHIRPLLEGADHASFVQSTLFDLAGVA